MSACSGRPRRLSDAVVGGLWRYGGAVTDLSAAASWADLPAWAAKLQDAPAALQLPADRARPTVLGAGIERYGFTVAADLVSAAQGLARDTDGDLYTVLLAAWQALLARYTDESDIAVGCRGVPATSSEPESEERMLVVRTRIDAGESFRSLARATLDQLREAVALGPVT